MGVRSTKTAYRSWLEPVTCHAASKGNETTASGEGVVMVRLWLALKSIGPPEHAALTADRSRRPGATRHQRRRVTAVDRSQLATRGRPVLVADKAFGQLAPVSPGQLCSELHRSRALVRGHL